LDSSLQEAVREVTEQIAGLRLETVTSIDAAVARLPQDDVVLALPHLTQKGGAGEISRLLRTVASSRRPVATLVIGEHDWAEQALALLRQGAADYLARPLDLTWLSNRCDALTVRARYQAAPTPKSVEVVRVGDDDPFLYVTSAHMGLVMEQVQRVAPQESTLLITGETGTGKTRLARLIHELSGRRGEPFLVANCGALAANLLESEMFGHVRGAFTGADRDRTGKLTQVGNGTLLLDEIDALPPELQVKLLHVVEERVFEPVGSNHSQPVGARVIVASNRDLERGVADGWFRSDLYYRLNVIAFYLPPLRERRSLIPALASHFLSSFAHRNRRAVHGIADDALRQMTDYEWPGNVRELRNVIERAVALCAGSKIQREDLPHALLHAPAPFEVAEPRRGAEIAKPAAPATLVQMKEVAEASHITEVLKKHKNNRLRAAAELGISRMTLYTKLHRYGLVEMA
jgi:two-component system, NtrC family, response regulator HydG